MISKYRMLESPCEGKEAQHLTRPFLGLSAPVCCPTKPHLATDIDHTGVWVIEGQQGPIAGIQLLQGHRLLKVVLRTWGTMGPSQKLLILNPPGLASASLTQQTATIPNMLMVFSIPRSYFPSLLWVVNLFPN